MAIAASWFWGTNNCLAQLENLSKYALPGAALTQSYGQESDPISTAPSGMGEYFIATGNVANAAGLFEPFVTSRDFFYNQVNQTRVLYPVGAGVHHSSTTICHAQDNATQGDWYFMGLSLIAGGVEYCYLVKLDAYLNVVWGHYWGQGRIRKVLWHQNQNSVIVYGQQNTGQLLVGSVDLNNFTGNVATTYNWTQRYQTNTNMPPIGLRQIAQDMVIEPTTGDIVLLGESTDNTMDINTTVIRVNATTGLPIWGADLGLPNVNERPRTLCIGPGSGFYPHTIAIAGSDNGQDILATNINPWNGGVLWNNRLSSNAGEQLGPHDMLWNPTANNYWITGFNTNLNNQTDGLLLPVSSTGNAAGAYMSYNSTYSGFTGDFIFRDIELEAGGGMVMTGSGFHNNTFGVNGGHWFLRVPALGYSGPCTNVTNQSDTADTIIWDSLTMVIDTPTIFRYDPNNAVVNITHQTGCTNFVFKNGASAGVIEEEAPAFDPMEMKAWPNPASELVNLQVPVADDEQFTVRIFDISGRLVPLDARRIAPGKFELPVSHLPAGTYMAQMVSDQHQYRKAILVE